MTTPRKIRITGLRERGTRTATEADARRSEIPETADAPALDNSASLAPAIEASEANERHATEERDLVALYESFWEATEELRTIRDFARARWASPWAVLGCVLARVIACAPPAIQLPPLVGGHGSLNLFVALVGSSGAGKGAATSVAAEVVSTPAIHVSGLGSGEGFTHVYMAFDKATKVHTQRREAALFVETEIDNLTVLSGRSSATLSAQLRKGWMGEDLSFAYADPEKAAPIPAHSYRMCVILGAQPERSEALFLEVDGGLPQRFLFLPATDPGATGNRGPEPASLDLTIFFEDLPDRHVFSFPEEAVVETQNLRLSGIRGQEGDPLDAHRNLVRMKVAAGLALLHGRIDVDEELWRLAGVIMDVSDETRAAARRTLAEQGRTGIQRRASEAVEVERVRKRDAANHEATKKLLRNHLERSGAWISSSELRKKLAGNRRNHFEAAVSELLIAEEVEERVKEDGQEGTFYRLRRHSAYE